MSKIYDKYLELKKINRDSLYLFHSGKFYIFIADDADYINEFVVLKKTKFTNEVYKCGFPDSSLESYLKVFQNHKLNIEIVEPNQVEEIKINNDKIYKVLKEIDVNNITPVQALNKLHELKEYLND